MDDDTGSRDEEEGEKAGEDEGEEEGDEDGRRRSRRVDGDATCAAVLARLLVDGLRRADATRHRRAVDLSRRGGRPHVGGLGAVKPGQRTESVQWHVRRYRCCVRRRGLQVELVESGSQKVQCECEKLYFHTSVTR